MKIMHRLSGKVLDAFGSTAGTVMNIVQTQSVNEEADLVHLDVSHLPNEIYLIRAKVEGQGDITQRLVVTR